MLRCASVGVSRGCRCSIVLCVESEGEESTGGSEGEGERGTGVKTLRLLIGCVLDFGIPG